MLGILFNYRFRPSALRSLTSSSRAYHTFAPAWKEGVGIM